MLNSTAQHSICTDIWEELLQTRNPTQRSQYCLVQERDKDYDPLMKTLELLLTYNA